MTASQPLDALETMRLRLCAEREMLDGSGYALPNEPAETLLAVQLPDGAWPDVPYADDALGDWAAVKHLRRLIRLARAWQAPESPFYRDDNVLAAVLRGLDAWYARDPHNPNWWWNQIGAPLALGETLLCLKGVCDPSYIERAVPAFRGHEPIDRFTGQNLIWTATVMIYHGILTDDPQRVGHGFYLAGREVRVFPDDEGIQPDMSFHQHGKLLYSGGYGQGFAGDVGRLIALAAGTPFAVPAPVVERFTRYVLDGCRWMVRGRSFDPGVIGREITRQGHSAARLYAGLRCLAAFDHPRREEAQASLVVDPASGGALVTGNRHFWCSDFMVQQRPAYYLSVRVPSPRVLNADMAYGGGEGRHCHYMADGATFIMRDGDEYRDLFPTWNWRQIPGTTLRQQAGPFDPETLRRFGERAFAGGASDGSVGCMAVDYARDGVAAKRAWFLFDEGMVALGTGITCTAEEPVRTTLNQCRWRGPAYLAGNEAPLAAGRYPLAAGSAWWQDGVTYRILDGSGTLTLGQQTGAWSDCGVGSSEPVTLDVMNAGLEHGVKPHGATYAYAVLPGVSEQDAFADAERFVILRNDETAQAVWHAVDRRGHAVLYAPEEVTFPDGQRIAADRLCILLYHPRNGVTLTVAQPEQQDGLLTLTLSGPITDRISVSLPAGEYAGSSQTIHWQR